MFNFLINYLTKVHEDAADFNAFNIISFIERANNVKLLDLGCNDGSLTLRLSSKLITSVVYRIDFVDKRSRIASELGMKTLKCDLYDELPLCSHSVNVIVSNQVIEHSLDVDKFASEICRIFTYFGLKHFFQIHGFYTENIKGAGYYPFPIYIQKILSKIDPVHSHFITIKVRKGV